MRDESLTMMNVEIEDLRYMIDQYELEYSEALDRNDLKAVNRAFGIIQEMRLELDQLLKEEADFAAEDDSYLPASIY